MPYLVRERLTTNGKHMYLLNIPASDDCVGSWVTDKNMAKEFLTRAAAEAAAGKLSILNAGVIVFTSEQKTKEKEVSDLNNSKWVIQSNVSGEYLASAAAVRQTERWVKHIRKAITFESLKEAREFTTEFVIGMSTAPQSLDMDYIQIDQISLRVIDDITKVEELIRFPENKLAVTGKLKTVGDSEYIVRCKSSNLFFQESAIFSKVEKWSMKKMDAKRFPNATAASSAILRMVNNPRVEIIEVKYKATAEELEAMVSGKTNFRIKMKHGPQLSVERTYIGITEAEAVKMMFEEVARTRKDRFDIGTIEEVGPNACKKNRVKVCTPACKSM